MQKSIISVVVRLTAVVLTSTFIHCGATAGSSSDSGTIDSSTLFDRTDIEGELQFLLPFPEGDAYTTLQVYDGTFSHDDDCHNEAVDYNLPENSPIAASAAGRVIAIKEDSNLNGLTDEYRNDGNYVMIDHGYGVYSLSLHLCQNCVDVAVGDLVSQGEIIGQSGNTGYSSAPHLHFEIRSWADDCSVSYGLYDIPDTGGLPSQGTLYTSINNGSSDIAYVPSNIDLEKFSTNGVTLVDSLPWVLTKGESYTITGQTSNGRANVAIYLLDSDGNWVDGTSSPVTNGSFSMTYTVSDSLSAGAYFLALSTSNTESFSTTFSEYAWVE